MTQRTLARGALVAILGSGPLLVALGARALVERVAPAVAGGLSAVAAAAARSGDGALDAPPNDGLPGGELLPGIGESAPVSFVYPCEGLGAAEAEASPAAAPRAATSGRPRGIVVRRDLVGRAARSGARPTGVPVPAAGMRPAGLSLQGVGAFGTGLRDGDVLVQVGGAPATSPAAVAGAVAGALRAGAAVLGAVVWRGDRRIDVAIELPRRGTEDEGRAPGPSSAEGG